MQVTQGSLVIINANSKQLQVMWNGIKVSGVTALKVNFNKKVILRVKKENLQDAIIQELISNGISVLGTKK